jgi:hypothetical protein
MQLTNEGRTLIGTDLLLTNEERAINAYDYRRRIYFAVDQSLEH